MQDEILSDFDQRYGILYKELELVLTQASSSADLRLAPNSIGDGRLLFISHMAFETNGIACLAVKFFDRHFDVEVAILSCEPHAEGFKLEFKITVEIALKARILLQLAEIVHYQKQMLADGRNLSVDAAAGEWIAKYAEGFAAEFDKHINA